MKQLRAESAGDPIRGITTPFIKSLDATNPLEEPTNIEKFSQKAFDGASSRPTSSSLGTPVAEDYRLNHYLTKPEFQESLEYSRLLSEPLVTTNRDTADPAQEAREAQEHEARHRIAQEAVSRIVSLESATSRQHTRANVQRIIDTFGRHKTDTYLKPKAPSLQTVTCTVPEQKPTPRAGPDTGSSEVQIGILTAKIRVLADRYEGPNRNDKVNKRNLRLLLHRRQKLLRYMHRKERGSQRWYNMIDTLGLSEATWKGQIAVE